MKRSTRFVLIFIVVALLPVIVALQSAIDPQRAQFQPGRGVGSMVTQVGQSPVVLPSQFVAGTVIGFREVVAGLLWIRANEFFHTGNYEAIIPLTRIITWLDPHQVDVYRTGAWHLAYNMVDSAERADRRFLPSAIKFLEEGIQNNPGVSDLPFDLGFVLYALKAQDFEKSTYWIKKACEEKDSIFAMHRQVPHALEKEGKIDECIAQWRVCMKEAEANMGKNVNALNHLQVSKRNMELAIYRKVMRADLDKHRIDVGFDAQFRRLGPRKFVISGTANLPVGTRIDLVLQDEDYKTPDPKSFSWEVDPNTTLLTDTGIHGLFVENGKFSRKYDLSKDTKQYPFKRDRYKLILNFNPRAAVDYIQDKTGWSGEGITDKKYLDTSTPGVRKVTKVIYLDREDII